MRLNVFIPFLNNELSYTGNPSPKESEYQNVDHKISNIASGLRLNMVHSCSDSETQSRFFTKKANVTLELRPSEFSEFLKLLKEGDFPKFDRVIVNGNLKVISFIPFPII